MEDGGIWLHLDGGILQLWLWVVQVAMFGLQLRTVERIASRWGARSGSMRLAVKLR